MKNRTREICTSGSVRDEDGNILIYSAYDRGDRGDVGIIRSPVRASILPDHTRDEPDRERIANSPSRREDRRRTGIIVCFKSALAKEGQHAGHYPAPWTTRKRLTLVELCLRDPRARVDDTCLKRSHDGLDACDDVAREWSEVQVEGHQRDDPSNRIRIFRHALA